MKNKLHYTYIQKQKGFKIFFISFNQHDAQSLVYAEHTISSLRLVQL